MQRPVTSAHEVADTTARERRRRLVKVAAFVAIPGWVASLGVVLASALRGTDLVATQAGQRSVDLGWPLVWIRQDRSSLSPPLPYRLGLSSPWENPTGVSAVAFVGNVLIVFAVVVMVTLLVITLVAAAARLLTPRS